MLWWALWWWPVAKDGKRWVFDDQTHDPHSIQFPSFSTIAACAGANRLVSWHWSQGVKKDWGTTGVEEVATSVQMATQSTGSKEEQKPRKKPSSDARSAKVWPRQAHTRPIH